MKCADVHSLSVPHGAVGAVPWRRNGEGFQSGRGWRSPCSFQRGIEEDCWEEGKQRQCIVNCKAVKSSTAFKQD